MPSAFLQSLDFDSLTPARLWPRLDLAARSAAALALLETAAGDKSLILRAEGAIAATLRFRVSAVHKLPLEKKAGYMARLVHPDDTLATALLQALHLRQRREVLTGFLDALAIPHKDGLIDDEYKLTAPAADALAEAVTKLYAAYPGGEAEVYLATLLAFDPEIWSGLRLQLELRRAA